VLWQAGSSDRGRDFAAKHAEAIFAVHPNVARMRKYTDDLDQRLETKFGRAPGSVKRIYDVQTVVGLTRSEADEKYQRIRECIPLEGAVAWISGHFGPDFSKYDPMKSCRTSRSQAFRDCSTRSFTPRAARR
jgi:long-chain alkane monooxygenase